MAPHEQQGPTPPQQQGPTPPQQQLDPTQQQQPQGPTPPQQQQPQGPMSHPPRLEGVALDLHSHTKVKAFETRATRETEQQLMAFGKRRTKTGFMNVIEKELSLEEQSVPKLGRSMLAAVFTEVALFQQRLSRAKIRSQKRACIQLPR
eukprot:6203877-Pleurochrysis_carterae.AAC.2